MSYLSVGIKAISGGAKRLFKSKTAVKAIKEVKLSALPKTASFYDASTGITRNTREFKTTGSEFMKLVKNDSQVLPDGTKMSKSRVFGRWPSLNKEYDFNGGSVSIDRTKTITCEGNNILGGKTIKINKNYLNTYGDQGRNETLVKMYDKNGVLQHKELNIEYTNGSGYKVHATQDREFGNLNSSAADMLEEPTKHLNYKHELSEGNYSGLNTHHSNYGNFASEGTLYSRTAEANEAAAKAKIAAEQAAKEAAAKAAAEKAAKLKASRPKVTVGKVLPGLDVEDLKVVEKVQEDGGIKRYYFRPETGTNKRMPVIKTYDHGCLHEEWIKNGKYDMVYMKQIGKEKSKTIYMALKNGDSTQIIDSSGNHLQYIKDGEYGIKVGGYRADNEARVSRRHMYEDIKGYTKNLLDKFKQMPYERKNYEEAEDIIYNLRQKANKTFVDLEDLFSPYKK